jgi:dTDP-4-amino-4,6-dideoxygalactose transaminase
LLTPDILAACRERLDVVVPVHLAGRLCDLAGLAAICAQRGIRLLEDAAHAFGSTAGTMRCGDGTFGSAAIFSFHPVKNITTGEGGAIVTNDAAWFARLRSLRHHGIVREGFRGDLAARDAGSPWYHEFHQPSGNDRLSDLHAALGVSQSRKLEVFKAARATIIARYRAELAHVPGIAIAPEAHGQEPFWHLCLMHGDWERLGCDRKTFMARAAAAGIAPQVHYIPLHHQPVLAKAARASDLVGADRFYAGVVSLPCHPCLSGDEQGQVIAFLRALAAGVAR